LKNIRLRHTRPSTARTAPCHCHAAHARRRRRTVSSPILNASGGASRRYRRWPEPCPQATVPPPPIIRRSPLPPRFQARDALRRRPRVHEIERCARARMRPLAHVDEMRPSSSASRRAARSGARRMTIRREPTVRITMSSTDNSRRGPFTAWRRRLLAFPGGMGLRVGRPIVAELERGHAACVRRCARP